MYVGYLDPIQAEDHIFLHHRNIISPYNKPEVEYNVLLHDKRKVKCRSDIQRNEKGKHISSLYSKELSVPGQSQFFTTELWCADDKH